MTTANPDNWELSDLPTGVSLVGSIALSLSLARELGVFHQIDPTMLAMLSIQDILVSTQLCADDTLLYCRRSVFANARVLTFKWQSLDFL